MVNKGNIDVDKGDKMTDVASKSPRRKKVLKTHINNHGREVTEVL